METKNAQIKSTMLGIEDHGIMTFSLHLDYGRSGQSAGGFALDEYSKEQEKRIGSPRGFELIRSILEIVGVETWEDLPGKHIRARADHGKVYAIGNVLKDEWLDFGIFFGAHKSN